MGFNRSYIRDEDGNITAVRDTSDDGRTSYIYEYDDSLAAKLPFVPETGQLIEKQSHDEDGTTHTLERNDSSSDSDSSSSSSGCFFTTACVNHAGLGDDCEELEVLRAFRDDYISLLPAGSVMISRYYTTAPRIVDAIRGSLRGTEELERMYIEIQGIVTKIKAQRYAEAVDAYARMFHRLNASYT